MNAIVYDFPRMDKDSFLNTIIKMMSDDKNLYELMCSKSRKMFEDKYSFCALGNGVSKIVNGY